MLSKNRSMTTDQGIIKCKYVLNQSYAHQVVLHMYEWCKILLCTTYTDFLKNKHSLTIVLF